MDDTATLARRARGVLATSSNVEVGVAGRHLQIDRHVAGSDGSVLFPLERIPYRCRRRMTQHAAVPLELVAVDVARVPQPDRVRGCLRLNGEAHVVEVELTTDIVEHLRLETDARLVRFAAAEVTLDWRVEVPASGRHPRPVPVEAWVTAEPDPLVGWEGEWTEHLDRHHAEQLSALARRIGVRAAPRAVHPVLADTEGIVLRCYVAGESVRDVRMPFLRRVDCPCRAVEAFDELVRACR
ncbi:MAG: DUF2470 domain-containing protein [Dermatophilaceae bacterium]